LSFESLLPKLFRCPECHTELHEIVYGMLAGPPKDNQVAGGCEWSDEAPTRVCPKCKWEGGLGGRTWPTKGSHRVPLDDPSAEFGVRVETIDFDLTTMTNDELFRLGRVTVTARLELVHRGLDAEDIDDYYDLLDDGDARSWPLIRKDACFVFYNSDTHLIEQACTYGSQRSMHEFLYLRQGMDDWQMVDTLEAFHDVVFGMKNPSLQVWEIEVYDDELTDEDADSEPFNYGSEVIKALLAGEAVTDDELAKEGDQYEKPIFWPHWFDPGAMLNFVQNPWVQN
jgi:hypothetical protein